MVIDAAAEAIFGLASDAINRIWPDPTKQAEEKRRLAQMMRDGDIERLKIEASLLIAQTATNRESARHGSVFVAGARPFIIWVCGVGLVMQYIIYPLLSWSLVIAGSQSTPEPLDMSTMMPLLLGLLGLGTMRSYDKTRKTDTQSVGSSVR